MFKKMLTLMMAISIFTVSAHASTHNGLKAAFDELNYSLNVEWDQKDQAFYKGKVEAFTSTMKDLQSKGLTNAQLIEFVKAEVKDQKVAKDIETALNIIALNKMSPTEASRYMVTTMEKSYSKGASWSGAAHALLGLGVLFVVAAVLVGGGFVYYGGSTCGYSYYYCGENYYTYEPNYCCY